MPYNNLSFRSSVFTAIFLLANYHSAICLDTVCDAPLGNPCATPLKPLEAPEKPMKTPRTCLKPPKVPL